MFPRCLLQDITWHGLVYGDPKDPPPTHDAREKSQRLREKSQWRKEYSSDEKDPLYSIRIIGNEIEIRNERR